MIKRSGGTWPQLLAGNVNVVDGPPNVSVSGWSVGGSSITPTELYPAPGKRWSILGFSITANLALDAPVTVVAGKLGEIVGGISQLGPAAPVITAGMAPLPADTTSLATLFDPAINPLPPLTTSITPPPVPLPVSCALTLPVPLVVPPGSQVYMGLWIKPSLTVWPSTSAIAQTGALFVSNAEYVIVYDDGSGK